MNYATFHNEFEHGGLRHLQMTFRCGTTIKCVPPYLEGCIDTVWIKIKGALPKTTDRNAIEDLAGMRILPLEKEVMA
ncbi:MAG: hypothetical protein WCJ49_06830 [Deltaproteobacteria bacterium]